jgi:hypothetical protein
MLGAAIALRFLKMQRFYQAACGGSNLPLHLFSDSWKRWMGWKRRSGSVSWMACCRGILRSGGTTPSKAKDGLLHRSAKASGTSLTGRQFFLPDELPEPYAELYYSLPGSERPITVDIAAELGTDGVGHEVRAFYWKERTSFTRSANSHRVLGSGRI